MPRILSKRPGRFHVAGSSEHPTGRLVTLEEHPALDDTYYADINAEEAAHLDPEDVKKEGKHKTHLTANGWVLTETPEEEQARRYAAAEAEARGKSKGPKAQGGDA